MLRQRARAVAAGLRILDLGLVAAAFAGARALQPAVEPGGSAWSAPAGLDAPWVALALIVWTAVSEASGVYGVYRTRRLVDEVGRIALAGCTAAAVLAGVALAGRDPERSRLLLGVWSAVAVTGLAGSRVALRTLARALRRRGYNSRTFAVVGSGPLAHRLRRELLARQEWGFTFAGFVLERGSGRGVAGPVLGELAELREILQRQVLDFVVVAVPRERLAAAERALEACEEQGIPVKIGLDLFPSRRSRLAVEDLSGQPLLSFSTAPEALLPLLAKRAFDVVGSVAGLVLLAPVLAVAAAAVALDSRGPILFRQQRVGLHGRRFTLYKFRSMRCGAEAERAALEHRNEMDGPVFKLRSDPRVTRVGRLLRRTSLDELPQLWNVLRGEMSLVGPRPPLPDEVRRYEPWQRRRLSVKPGLTCTWQVSGRSEVGFRRWMELDLAYIDRWSLWQDVRIVLRTIPAVLLGRGAR
ncbi:MAG: sugar transferase [Anaeromyxobacter sp.]